MKVYVKKDDHYTKEENFEQAMKIFKRRVNNDGVLQEVRKREFYIKPGVKKRLKSEAARKALKKKKKY